MNIDIIVKLIKLANNNSNDNEANLAARKVCKMLADYKFSQPVSTSKVRTVTNPTSHYDFWNDIMKQRAKYETYHKQATYHEPKQEPVYSYNECVACGTKYPCLKDEKPKPIKNFVCANCQEKVQKERKYTTW